MVSIKIALIFL